MSSSRPRSTSEDESTPSKRRRTKNSTFDDDLVHITCRQIVKTVFDTHTREMSDSHRFTIGVDAVPALWPVESDNFASHVRGHLGRSRKDAGDLHSFVLTCCEGIFREAEKRHFLLHSISVSEQRHGDQPILHTVDRSFRPLPSRFEVTCWLEKFNENSDTNIDTERLQAGRSAYLVCDQSVDPEKCSNFKALYEKAFMDSLKCRSSDSPPGVKALWWSATFAAEYAKSLSRFQGLEVEVHQEHEVMKPRQAPSRVAEAESFYQDSYTNMGDLVEAELISIFPEMKRPRKYLRWFSEPYSDPARSS